MPDPSASCGFTDRLFPAGDDVSRWCRNTDWSQTSLGPPDGWPASLRSVAGLVLAAPQPMLVLWGAQLVQLYNDAFRVLRGRGHPAALGQPARDGWPELWQVSLPFYQGVLERGESFTCRDQRLLIERDGHHDEAFFTLSYSPVRDEQGQVAGVLVCAEETTGTRRAREETELERRRLDAALELLPVGVWITDAKGQILYSNPAASRIWGGDAPRLGEPEHYQRVYRGWWPDGRPLGDGEWGLARAVQRGESSGPEEIHIQCFDGRRRVVLNYGLPIRDACGRIAGAVAVTKDISAAKQAEEALRQSEKRFRALVHAGTQMVYRMNADWTVMLEQQGAGLVAHKACPNPHWLTDFILPEERPRVREAIARAIASRGVFELEHRVTLADGSPGWTLSRAVPLLDAQGQISEWFGAATNITLSKRAEQALRESEEKYRSLFGSLHQGFTILELLFDEADEPFDYRFLEVNAAFQRHTGLEDARGRRVRELLPALDAFWPQTYGRVALTGEPVSFTHYATVLNRWFEVYAFRIGAAEHRQVAVLFADVTEQREAEALRAEDARRKDEFLAMLGHELRNPLAAVHNALWLLQRRVSEPLARNYLDIIERQSSLLRGLVDDLLDVSRITRGLVEVRHEPVDLVAVVRHALEGVQGLMASLHHQLTLDLPAMPVMVCGDRVRLDQVLGNLLTNAAKYTDPGGRIAIALAVEQGGATLRVRDNGIGMTAETLAQVFELFAQAERGLDRAQGGLGIGLTVVRKLVELHGGTVTAQSAGPGQGSLFTVRLPLSEQRVAPTLPAAAPRPQVATRQVLVVDDNHEIATTLGHLLEQVGHRVSLAHDGHGALARARAERPEVVLLDIGLPGLNGYQVAERLREDAHTRDMLLVALTGYGQAADRVRALDAGFDAHFIKPVDIDALGAFIARGRRA